MVFRRIDDFVFDRVFQPIVDRFPDQGPVGVARFFITGAAALFMLSSVASFRAHDLFNDSIGFIWVIYAGVDCLLVARNRTRPGAINPLRPKLGFWRFALAFMTVTLAVCAIFSPEMSGEAFIGGAGLYLCFEYASACDVRPPKTRKAPFWRSLFQPSTHAA